MYIYVYIYTYRFLNPSQLLCKQQAFKISCISGSSPASLSCVKPIIWINKFAYKILRLLWACSDGVISEWIDWNELHGPPDFEIFNSVIVSSSIACRNSRVAESFYFSYSIVYGKRKGTNLVDIRDVVFTRASYDDPSLPPAKLNTKYFIYLQEHNIEHIKFQEEDMICIKIDLDKLRHYRKQKFENTHIKRRRIYVSHSYTVPPNISSVSTPLQLYDRVKQSSVSSSSRTCYLFVHVKLQS